ncbi:MAG TPA: type II secretion system F family protein [Candidatus Hydrogenedentes bacterium]|nr:type II secretion system F family protein [Candidatus Hydrogenedentota bacterium]
MGLVSSQLPMRSLVVTCRQLSTAYNAGIPILQGIELTERQARGSKTRQVLAAMRHAIRSGSTLADAARAQAPYLPRILIELLDAGEKGGRLDVMLRDLADYYEDRLAMRREIVGALVYPVFMLFAAWYFGSFALMLVNRLLGVFAPRADAAFDFEAFFRDYFQLQLFAHAAALAVVAVCIVLARMGVFRWISSLFTTFLWPFSAVTRRFALSRFFRTMSLLIGSGLPIVACIERSAAVALNPYIERDLLKAVPYVKEGSTLTHAFAGVYLTATAREMLHVGEETGSLEVQLRKVSDYHLAEALQAVQMATRLLRVLVMLIVGATVGLVVIRFYATLYGGMLDELEGF